MRKLGKKIIALALTGAMIFSSAIMSFANTLTPVEKFQVIQNLGVIKGEGTAVDGKQIMTRYRAFTMQLRLLGKEEEMNKYNWKGQPSFKDAYTAKGDFELRLMAYLFNHREFGIIGDAKGLRPYDSVNGKEYAKVMLTALGYEYGIDYNWNNIAQKAKEVGIVEDASMVKEDKALTLQEVATWTYNTLAQVKKGSEGKGTLGEELGFVVKDTLPPSINIEKISEKVAEAQITIKGTTEVGTTLLINKKEVEVDKKGNFSTDIALNTGKNTIKLVATDKVGNTLEKEMIIEREKLDIQDIKSNNLKTAYVIFNQKVDKKTIVDTNFTVKQKSTKVPVTAQLLEDGKTVELTAKTQFLNQKDYDLTVNNVKTIDGIEMKKITDSFRPLDSNLPEAEKITVTGPRDFQIEFNEPIKELGKVEIKYGKNSTLGAQVSGDGTNKVSVKLYRDLKTDETYTVSIHDFKDYANYENISKTLEFKYEKVKDTPSVKVEKAEPEYVILSFNKPVHGLTADHFYHTFTAWKPVEIYKDSEMTQKVQPQDHVSTVYLQFYKDENSTNRPIPEGTTILGIRAKANGYQIQDNWENKLEDTEIKLNVSADRSKPEVSDIHVVSESKLRIKFNKTVTFNKDNIEILNENGDKINGLRVLSVTGKGNQYEVELNKNLSGKTILVHIKNVEDTTLMNNRLKLYTETITITDKTAPSVDKVYYDIQKANKEFASKVLYVQFNEEVEEDTALDQNNYFLVINGQYFPISGDIEFVDSNTRVCLTLTDAQANLLQSQISKAQLFVTNVKDMAGNTMKPATHGNFLNLNKSQDVRPNVSVAAVKKDTLEVTFDERLNSVDRHAFTINGKTPVGMTIHEKENKTIVELVYEDKFNTNAKDIVFQIKTTNDAQIVNSFGTKVNFNETYKVKDQIVPEIVSAIASGNTITIKFSEAMNKNSFSILSFSVRDKKVTAYHMDDKTLDTLTLTIDGDALIKNEKIELEQRYTVLDENNNEFNLKDALEITVSDTNK